MKQCIYCLQICVETMMHLTCTNMPQDKLSQALDKVSNTAVAQHAVLQLVCSCKLYEQLRCLVSAERGGHPECASLARGSPKGPGQL